jgi:hypothetical protein
MLDSDPLRRTDPIAKPCDGRNDPCIAWDSTTIWIEPGALTISLELTAFPAFVVGVVVVHCLGRLGNSEVSIFLISMLLLISGWYYSVGWLVDRWRGATGLFQ